MRTLNYQRKLGGGFDTGMLDKILCSRLRQKFEHTYPVPCGQSPLDALSNTIQNIRPDGSAVSLMGIKDFCLRRSTSDPYIIADEYLPPHKACQFVSGSRGLTFLRHDRLTITSALLILVYYSRISEICGQFSLSSAGYEHSRMPPPDDSIRPIPPYQFRKGGACRRVPVVRTVCVRVPPPRYPLAPGCHLRGLSHEPIATPTQIISQAR